MPTARSEPPQFSLPRRMLTALAGTVLILTLWPASATGQWFWGFGAGLTRHDVSIAEWDDGSLTGGDTDRSDYGLKLLASYEFGPHFALEAAVVSLGESRIDSESSGGDFWLEGPVRGKASTLGLSGSALGRWPLTERTTLLARGGVFYWNTDITIDDEQARESGDRTGTSPLFGLGVDVAFDRATRVRVEWERYMDLDKGLFGKYDVDMISASFMVNF